MNSDIHCMSSPNSITSIHPLSSKQHRQFIKASSVIIDESDEIVNDLMNIVAIEKLKTQGSIKRHASFDQTSSSSSSNYTMNKKRYLHNKKRLPTLNHISQNEPQQKRIGGHLLRPQIVLNRYGDIGNYVPKFLRENVTMRSSDSNENIFFRSTNGFLKLDFLSSTQTNDNYHQSSPCLNQDQSMSSLIQKLRKTQT
jgi:hypothetical protein